MDKTRNKIFVGCLALLLVMVVGYQQTTPNVNAQTQHVKEVTVQAGDTLWDIAARTSHSNMDVREMVYAVKELNQISDSGSLVPGTKIKVPVHTNDSPVRAMDYVAQN